MSSTSTTVGGPYLWEHAAWPDDLTWSAAAVTAALTAAHRAQGRLLAKASLVGMADRAALEAGAYEDEAVGTAQIEGERLDRDSVRSSVARQLGLERGGAPVGARNVDGIVAVLLDATRNAAAPVTLQRLCGWQAALFPTGFSGPHRIAVGALRTGPEPMRVMSGAWGRPVVHFEAPPSDVLPEQLARLLAWLEAAPEGPAADAFVRAGLAHLRLVTLHPFDDGNGRVTRALTDLVLARADTTPRLWSLSAQIEQEREPYYTALQSAQRGEGDVTDWIVWFLGCTARALGRAEAAVDRVLARVRFWAQHGHLACNPRQRKIVDRLLQAGPDGFVGGMTTRKAAALTGASRATAQRDLAELVDAGLLEPLAGGGRSAAYALAWG
jgi:Fic family protein